MSDTASAATAATAPAATAPPAAAPAPDLEAIAASLGVDVATLTAALAATPAGSASPAAAATAPAPVTPGGVPAAPAAPAAAAAPAAPTSLVAGNLVSYTWEDSYAPGPDGKGTPRTRHGIVVGVPAFVEGEAPTVTVSWLEGTATMPAELLDAVTGA